MSKMKVYLSEDIAESAYQRLAKEVEIVRDFNNLEELDAILTRNIKITRDMMQQAKNLKIVSIHGTGMDKVDLTAAEDMQIKVTNVPGENALSVAELAVTFMLALARRIKEIDQGVREARYKRPGEGSLISFEVTGKTLGIVGAGHVAMHIKTIMQNAFGMDVLCYNPYLDKEECRKLGIKKIETLEELFSLCDFISVNVPYTEETHNLINAAVLRHARKNLILVNTSRGRIVNEDDLYHALAEGKILGAASDVFAIEPPEKDNPLLRLNNFLATPHIAATTKEALDRVGNKAVENILDTLLG